MIDNSPLSTSELPPTVEGIDTRLACAVARFQAAQKADDRGRTPATLTELVAARAELIDVRKAAMDAALDEYYRGM